jgi:1,4-dihydroxy-6-naphthoate synthase
MFWALSSGRLDPDAWGFGALDFRATDTETLNRWAAEGAADVVAVSIAHVPEVAANYLLLPHGGSVGRGYGPVVVTRRASTSLAGLRVGIPGERTTAARLLRAAAPDAVPVVVPFAESLEAIDRGEVDAAVLIHEGRLVYRRLGFRLALDLGVWWRETTRLPLPLGGNVIRRALGGETIARASAMLRESIAYALAHRDDAISELLSLRRGMSRDDADLYLRLYANDDTLDYGLDGRAGVVRLLGHDVDWAP